MVPLTGILANLITSVVYLSLFIWILQFKKKQNITSILFISWLFSMFLVASIFLIEMALMSFNVSLIAEKIIHSALLLNALLVFYFSLSFNKDLRKIDLLYVIPGVVIIFLIWTKMISKIDFQIDRYIPVFDINIWVIFILVVFSIYVASLIILFRAFIYTKKHEEPKYSRRILMLMAGIALILIIGIIQPYFRHYFNNNLGSDIITFLFSIPAILMAISFKLE